MIAPLKLLSTYLKMSCDYCTAHEIDCLTDDYKHCDECNYSVCYERFGSDEASEFFTACTCCHRDFCGNCEVEIENRSETLTDKQFQDDKMCCDKPLFHDDEEEDDDEVTWFNENYPDASCHRCSVALDGSTVVYCGGGGGACETWYCAACHEEGTDDCVVCQS